MDAGILSIVISILAGSAAIIWHASKIKANVDTHGNAIGELRENINSADEKIENHHGRIAMLEGRATNQPN